MSPPGLDHLAGHRPSREKRGEKKEGERGEEREKERTNWGETNLILLRQNLPPASPGWGVVPGMAGVGGGSVRRYGQCQVSGRGGSGLAARVGAE
ncbi:hypothetical protein GOBAR_AA26850 [Gossypium barbadense]|uniref:Uncharacterized protein n=1 Tax=Gossypium barbadense TaxID=3634 RepID=A0A2P5WRU5_GOSBA|nr:hypothetical protein GOBAR_AA26850 [Gossypium barbadense]